MAFTQKEGVFLLVLWNINFQTRTWLTRVSCPSRIFIWADYYPGRPPGTLLSPFQYTNPANRKGSTSACDAAHTWLCAGLSQGDVHSRWVPGADGRGLGSFLTALLLCRRGAFTREDICIGTVQCSIKALCLRLQTGFGDGQWRCPHRAIFLTNVVTYNPGIYIKHLQQIYKEPPLTAFVCTIIVFVFW